MGTGLVAGAALGALERLHGALAAHLFLPPLGTCTCPQDAVACLVVVLIRVYNQLIGHPCA